MKTKHIITITAFMLFTLASFVAKAQDKQVKYEYAIVYQYGTTAIMFTTADKEESTPSKVKDIDRDLLGKVNELNEKGWEVYNTYAAIYYLRRKKE
jgi:hypothetical protein